jgi:hypothetical protein
MSKFFKIGGQILDKKLEDQNYTFYKIRGLELHLHTKNKMNVILK